MMEDSPSKVGRTLGRTRTMTHSLQIIINVRLQSKYQPNVHFILLKRKKKYIPTDIHTTQEVG